MAETPCENTVAMAAPATPLAQEGRPGHTGHTHVEPGHEQDVHADVGQRRDGQEVERRLAVTQCTDNTGQQIIEESKGNPDKRDKQVIIGSREYVLRRTHHVQNVCTVKAGNHGNDNRHHRSQLQADSHITAHRDIIPRTELLRHGNAETSATAIAESQNKKNDRSACPD